MRIKLRGEQERDATVGEKVIFAPLIIACWLIGRGVKAELKRRQND